MNYALIENGMVVNLIYLHPMNLSDFPNAVFAGNLPVTIGDSYDGEFFWRNGEKVTENMPEENEEEDMREALELLGVNANG